jgi:hypothetical protein
MMKIISTAKTDAEKQSKTQATSMLTKEYGDKPMGKLRLQLVPFYSGAKFYVWIQAMKMYVSCFTKPN